MMLKFYMDSFFSIVTAITTKFIEIYKYLFNILAAIAVASVLTIENTAQEILLFKLRSS